MVCDSCNVYFTGVLDRRRSITKYVSQHSCGRHVGGGVTPQEIQTRASHTGEIMKLVLLEKLQWCLASLGLQKGDEQKEGARYQVNCCQGGYFWDLVAMNSSNDGFGSYYSTLFANK